MPSTLRTSRKASNRNTPMLSDTDERRRDSLLRSAWLQTVAGFPCRPSPRSIWDETATGDQTPWRYVVTPIRAAILQAVESGNPQLIEQTLEGARAFCHELAADFASLVPQPAEESIVQMALAETQSEGPANEMEAALLADPTPVSADRAVLPLARHYEKVGQLLERCRRFARSRSTPLVSIGGVR